MSGFERASIAWYIDNVHRFNFEAGMMPELIQETGFTGAVRVIFLRAVNSIFTTLKAIEAEKSAKAQGA